MYYECLVHPRFVMHGEVTETIVRWFDTQEKAYAWLTLEGYEILSIRPWKEKTP